MPIPISWFTPASYFWARALLRICTPQHRQDACLHIIKFKIRPLAKRRQASSAVSHNKTPALYQMVQPASQRKSM